MQNAQLAYIPQDANVLSKGTPSLWGRRSKVVFFFQLRKYYAKKTHAPAGTCAFLYKGIDLLLKICSGCSDRKLRGIHPSSNLRHHPKDLRR